MLTEVPATNRARPGTWQRHPEWFVGVAIFALLVATSDRYGWHRDELYFLAAGRHPAWGYPDQPLLTPLLAAGMNVIGHGSLVVVRLASALASAATSVAVAGLAAEMGGGRRARLIAASVWAVSGFSLVTGHLVSTTTFDVLATAICCWCLARALARRQPHWLFVAGLVMGIGLLNKSMVAIVMGCVVVGVLITGPRRTLFSWWSVGAVCAAMVGTLPYVVWQASHGWPQFDVAHAIAQTGDQGGRVGVIPFQVLLIAPPLAPIWIAGLFRLARDRRAAAYRGFAAGYGLLVVAFIVTGGKSYYLGGLLAVLVAAGAITADEWLARGTEIVRRRLLVTAIGLSLAVNACVGLAVIPERAVQPAGVNAVNPEAGEQIGWGRFTDTVAAVWRRIPPADRRRAVIFAGNYGEAGAIGKYGRSRGLPSAYSSHNAFYIWGPPPTDKTGPVVITGVTVQAVIDDYFRACQTVATMDNGIGLNNKEQHLPIRLCAGTTQPWSVIWPKLRHYN